MGILKKKCGRPRKDGSAPQNMKENDENNASAQELSIDKLIESLVGKYITFAKGDFHSQFRIAEVAKVYGNVEVRETIGGGNGDALMLSMECASDLIRCGYFLTDVSSFALMEKDPDTGTGTASQKECEKERMYGYVNEPVLEEDVQATREFLKEKGLLDNRDSLSADPSKVVVETLPFVTSSEGTGEPAQKGALAVKGSDIVLDGIGEVEGAFLDLLTNLKGHGCAPMLVHRASKAADRLYEALYEMEKWYREKEGGL